MSSKSLPARVAPYAICVFVALFSLPAWTQGDPQEAVSLLSMVLFSFVGGLILNLIIMAVLGYLLFHWFNI